MVVSMVNDLQPHLSTLSVGYNRSTLTKPGNHGPVSGVVSTRLINIDASWSQTQQAKSSINAAGRQVRNMDNQVQNAAAHIQRMSDAIRAFRKNFPPFPRGSEERERILNSFQAIRKQIQRLTIPPPKKDVAQTLQKTEMSHAKSTQKLIAGFEKLLRTIGERLPAFSDDVSDSAFEALQGKLESLQEFIAQKRAELVQEIAPKKYYDDEEGGRQLTTEMTAFSITIGQTFAEQSEWQMTVSSAHIKALQV